MRSMRVGRGAGEVRVRRERVSRLAVRRCRESKNSYEFILEYMKL